VKKALPTQNEDERLAALQGYGILDTPSDTILDFIVQAAADACDVPIALVSLVDENRQWFKARYGLDATETPRDVSFCGHAIHGKELFQIPDALKDERFADNPLVVDDPNVRFYAGQPLANPDGHAVGTLCVIDHSPRTLSAEQEIILERLGNLVTDLIDGRRAIPIVGVDLIVGRSVRLAMVITDPHLDGNPVVYCNQAFEDMTGYSRGEILGQTLSILSAPEADPAALATLNDAIDGSSECRVVLRGQRKSGERFWNELALSPVLDSKRNVTHFVAMLEDVTSSVEERDALKERGDELENLVAERTEKYRQAKIEAEEATVFKSQFLASASHDLRQPLQSISAYLHVLRRKQTDPDHQALTEKIQKSVSNMAGILEALLDVSKIDAGVVTAEIEEFDTNAMFDRVRTNCAPLAEEKHLALSFSDEPLWILSDPKLLDRVLENFVTNAIRYTDSGSVTVGHEKIDDQVRIFVTDTGSGISREDQNRIFDEFVQVGNDARSAGMGLGLGLALVKRLSDLLNAPIDVQSEPGVGSTFSITVPSATQNPRNMVPATEPDTDAAVTIVFIEDNSAILDATSMDLEMDGFTVHPSPDRRGALAHVRTGIRPDIIISDYRLVEDNGVDVVKALRSELGEDIPAIFMTGDTSATKIAEARLPACEIVYKPAPPGELARIVQQLLG